MARRHRRIRPAHARRTNVATAARAPPTVTPPSSPQNSIKPHETSHKLTNDYELDDKDMAEILMDLAVFIEEDEKNAALCPEIIKFYFKVRD